MKKIVLSMLFGCLVSLDALAGSQFIEGLKISRIRTVADYGGSDTTYDNSIELWFTVSLPFNSSVPKCTERSRVYIPLEHVHLISAAYAAQMNNKSVNIMVDDSLVVRNGSCEISFLDVMSVP